MYRLSLILFVWMFFVNVGNAQDAARLISEGEQLVKDQKEPQALDKFLKAIEMEPTNYAALHNASFLYSRIGNRYSSKDEQRAYFRKGDALADRAIKANPSDAEGYFVKSVSSGRIALIAGAKERVKMSTTIKENVEKAISINKNHAGAWHVLGRWHAKVANLSFAEKAAANTLFGGLPKGASNEEAKKCYQTALKLRPGYLLYMYDYAGALYFNKEVDACKKVLGQIIFSKPADVDDPKTIREARAMLSQL